MSSSLPYEVNCSILFTELPLLERPAAVKRAGFDARGILVAVRRRRCPPTRTSTRSSPLSRTPALQLVGLNFFAGDMPGGDRGLVSWPARSRSSATTST